MTPIDVHDTLGQLVLDNPARARVLERLDLDYCCHGRTTLLETCAQHGLDPEVVVAALSAAVLEPVSDWQSLGPAQLADHIEQTHHAYLHEELERLSALAAKVEAAHGVRHPELGAIRSKYEVLRADLEPHLLKEEQVLFPMIQILAHANESPSFHCGTLRNPISRMLAEHSFAGDVLAELRDLTNDYVPPVDACASYQMLFKGLAELEADTHLHIHKENNVLFPAVLELEQQLAS
jgi:regulator of cell morphogenesis and NO signaling